MYYLKHCKEFQIFKSASHTLLFFFLFSITFQPNVFAGVKEKSAEEYRLQGYESQQKGKLEEALTFYAKAASLSPANDSVPIYNDMGVIYEQLGLLDEAAENYQNALDLNDHYLPACTNLAYLYKKEGDLERAAQYFQQRVEWGEPTDPWTKKAKDELSEIGKQIPRVKKWLMRHETMEMTEEVTRNAQKEFSDSLARANSYYENGEAFAKKKRYDQALEEYTKALSLAPNNPKIIRARDEARLKFIQERAREHADSAIKLLDLGDTVSAKIEFRKILTLIPDEPLVTK